MALTMRRFPELSLEDHRYAMRYAGVELGRLEFKIVLEKKGVLIRVHVLDFTSRGFGVSLSSQDVDGQGIKAGDLLHLVSDIPELRKASFPCTVAYLVRLNDAEIQIGLQRNFHRTPSQGLLEMRKTPRMPLPAALGLVVTTPHPLLFGHVSRMRLVDVNLGMGYCLETDDPFFLGYEGAEIALYFPFPNCTDQLVSGQINWLQPLDSRRIRIGVQTWDMPFDLYQSICRYLLNMHVFTPGLLREAGFIVRHVKQDLRIRQVGNLREYAAVLELRAEASGKPEADSVAMDLSDMSRPSDSHSRIIAAWWGERLIGGLTLFFEADNPRKRWGMEIVDVCIASDYRGTDVLQGLMEHAIKSFLLSDRHYLQIHCDSDEMEFYLQLGFRQPSPEWQKTIGLEWKPNMLVLEREDILRGRGIHLLAWSAVYGSLMKILMRKKLIRLTARQYCAVTLKAWLIPLVQSAAEKKIRKAYQDHLRVLRNRLPWPPPTQPDWRPLPR